jgi:hypothetical protein
MDFQNNFPLHVLFLLSRSLFLKQKTMTEQKEKKSTGRKIKIAAYWLCTGIVALETAAGAQWDLSRNQFVRDVFTHLGYPHYLLTIIGAWKIPAFIVLLLPKFPLVKEWAYAGLFFVYTGAAFSHMAAGDDYSKWLGPLIFSFIVVGSWALRPESRRLRPLN